MPFDVMGYLRAHPAQPISTEHRRALANRPTALAILEQCNGVVFAPTAEPLECASATYRMGYGDAGPLVQQWSRWIRRRLTVVGLCWEDEEWFCVDDYGGCFVVGGHQSEMCMRGPGTWIETIAALMDGVRLRPVLEPWTWSVVSYGETYRWWDRRVWRP